MTTIILSIEYNRIFRSPQRICEFASPFLPIHLMNTSESGTNPHAAPPVGPKALLTTLWRHRELIVQMSRREILGRYRGSVMGLAWSFFNPILMLVVYTFVFSVVFKARWGLAGEEESKTLFAIVLFVGLIVHGLFAEILNRAPSLIIGNVNYVKKVVFPIEILPAVTVVTALFHTGISLTVMILSFFIFNGYVHWTVTLTPLVILPFILLVLGLAWVLASLGVFLRDVSHTIGIFTTVMLFLAPVMYPVSAVPKGLQPFIMLNPLTFIIEEARKVLIYGIVPDWVGLGLYLATACMVAWLGFAWFQKTRRGFADVI